MILTDVLTTGIDVLLDQEAEAHQLKVAAEADASGKWAFVGSRSDGAEALAAYSTRLSEIDLVSMGSPLNLFPVVEGKAHLYPCFALTFRGKADFQLTKSRILMAGGYIVMSNTCFSECPVFVFSKIIMPLLCYSLNKFGYFKQGWLIYVV